MWKDIKGYEGIYQVNENGVVRNITSGLELKQHKSKYGYMLVYLWKNNKGKTYRAHRLVAEAFIPNPQNKPQVNHIDCDRTNNNVSNLEWVTNQENHDWSVRLGRRVMRDDWREKIIATRKRKPVIGKSITTGEIIRFNSVRAVEDFGIDTKSVIDCCKGRRKTAHGYSWCYVESEGE